MFKQIFSPALSNFWLFTAFGIGIIAGFYFPYLSAFIPLFLLSAVLIFIFSARHRFLLSDIFIIIMFLSLGALWYLPCGYQNVERFLGGENKFILQVSSLPKETASRNVFFADIKNINGVTVAQRARVIDRTRKMEYLNSYKVNAKLSRVTIKNHNFYTLWVNSSGLEKLPASALVKFNQKITRRLLDILQNNLTDESYRFVASVFFGRRELLNKWERDAFTDAGIAHLLAISGSNVGLIALVLFFIFRLFNIKFRICLFLSVFFLFIYAIITGANPPTLRAVVMYTVFSLSFLARRKLNPFNSLALAGFVCLLINPSWIFDVGFQLSFLSIFSLILGFKMFPIKQSKFGFFNQLQYLFFSSLYVTLLITPLVSYYFGRIYILSVLNNMMLIPFFTLILIVNIVLLIFSPVHFAAQSIGALLSVFVPLFYKLSHFLGSIKFSFVVCKCSAPAIFIYYVFIAGLLLLFKIIRHKRKMQMV